MIPKPSRTASPLLLGILLAAPATTASASTLTPLLIAPADRERSQLLVAEGDAAYANDHLAEAISKYRASYYGLSPDDQASYLGSLPVRKAMRAYERLAASEPDEARRRTLLQRQRVLLVEFLDAIAGKDGSVEDVGEEVIAELEEKLRAIDDALVEPEDDEPPPALPTVEPDEQEPLPAPPPTTPSPSPIPRDWLGLGLVIGGSATLLAGAGVSIGYLTIRNGADSLIEAGGEDRTPQQLDDYREQEYARAQNFLTVGSIVGGVGLAVAVGGAVRLALHRRWIHQDATALHVSPVFNSTGTGLILHRRF